MAARSPVTATRRPCRIRRARTISAPRPRRTRVHSTGYPHPAPEQTIELSASQTSVREALRQLQAPGLGQAHAHRGVTVSDVALADLDVLVSDMLDTYQALIVLQTAATLPFTVWMTCGYIIEIPSEVKAAMDGAARRRYR